MRNFVTCIVALLAVVTPLTSAYAVGDFADFNAVTHLLARELPRAIETRKFSGLEPYFEDDVVLTTNLVGLPKIEGKRGVLMVLTGMRGSDSIVDTVIVSQHSIIIVQNVPQTRELSRLASVPIVDTYYLSQRGRIQTVERVFGRTAMQMRHSN